jgi:hypothetical protein
MFLLTCKITIEGKDKYVFDYVNQISIKKSWKNLTQSGSIKLPSKATWYGTDLMSSSKPLIKVGDTIKIELGYDNNLETYFTGFITKIGIQSPFEIEFEDEMWKLKQINITKYSTKSTTIKKLLSDLITGYEVIAVDSQIGAFQITNDSIGNVLEYIEKNYGLVSYFVDGILYCGMAYYTGDTTYSNGDKIKFTPKNIYREFNNAIISDNLNYERSEDIKLEVKCISINKDNKREEVTVGDSGGASRVLHFYDVDKETMKKLAENEIKRLKVSGLSGDFTTFGDIKINFGDTVEIYDPKNLDRNGTYFVEGVETEFGINGFRQVVKIDGRASG